MMTTQPTITIDPTLRALIPPLDIETKLQLIANIREHGCRDALVVWEEAQILLDGHHRFDICQTYELPYTVTTISLPDRVAAQLWMIRNQRGRRNLTPEQQSYLRGKERELVGQSVGGDRRSDHSLATKELMKTDAQLADEYKVSIATLKKDEAYAKDIDTIATVELDARADILSRETKLTRDDIKTLADHATTEPETVKEALAEAKQAPTKKAARAVIKAKLTLPRSDQEPQDGGASDDPPPRVPLALEAEAPDAEPPAPARGLEAVSSGDFEWYTPPEIVALVRQVLGTIDVDPASCAMAQAVVQAQTYYTVDEDGLRQPWHGTVFCNPPYRMPEIARFCGKLVEERAAGHTTAAIFLVNAMTATDWFQFIAPRADALCFPDGKIHFWHATHDGLHPCQGNAILYFGPHVDRFCEVFTSLGYIPGIGSQTTAPQLPFPTTPVTPLDDPALPQLAALLHLPADVPTESTTYVAYLAQVHAASLAQLTSVVGEAQAHATGTRAHDVLALARDLQKVTSQVLTEQLGLTAKQSHQVLDRLARQGKLSKRGTRYRATYTYVVQPSRKETV